MLEAYLRELARAGQLRHVLLVRSGTKFQASFRHEDGSCNVDVRSDPVDALLVAIGAVSALELNGRSEATELTLEDMLA